MTARRIVCAAMIHPDTGDVICSPRHWDILCHQAAKLSGMDWLGARQGFVDQFGVFLTREEARPIAQAANQIVRRCGGDDTRLYSENLY